MSAPQDRRFEPRSPANTRAIVVAPNLEMPCQIVDISPSGLRIRMERNLALPRQIQIVDIDAGIAIDAEMAWNKGKDAGLKRGGHSSLRGLTPSRLAAARAAWLRAGGR